MQKYVGYNTSSKNNIKLNLKYIEKYHFDIDDSTEEIKSYIMIWWSNFVVDDTKNSKQTLRRWKRIIRCNNKKKK